MKSWIESGDKALKMELKAFSKNVLSVTNDNKNKVISRIDKQSREIKANRLGIWINIIFIVALGVLFYLNIL